MLKFAKNKQKRNKRAKEKQSRKMTRHVFEQIEELWELLDKEVLDILQDLDGYTHQLETLYDVKDADKTIIRMLKDLNKWFKMLDSLRSEVGEASFREEEWQGF